MSVMSVLPGMSTSLEIALLTFYYRIITGENKLARTNVELVEERVNLDFSKNDWLQVAIMYE